MAAKRDLEIGPGRVVAVFFKALDEEGGEIDSSARLDHKPLVFLFGTGGVLPGLEKLLEGKRKNDHVSGVVAPADAYGDHRPGLVEVVERDKIPVQGELQPGTRLSGYDPQGRPATALVTAVDGERVTIDRNHPLAGRSIRFEVTVAGVREASQEELDHGHPHGPGGHEH